MTSLWSALSTILSLANLVQLPSPACWSEPQMIYSALAPEFAQRIEIHRPGLAVPSPSLHTEAIESPSAQFELVGIDPAGLGKTEPSYAAVTLLGRDTPLLTISFRDAWTVSNPRWINERLIHGQAWWGRRVATEFIFDIVAEDFAWLAMASDGRVAMRQYQAGCTDPQMRLEREDCQCAAE